MSHPMQVFNQQPGMPPPPPGAAVQWMQPPPAMPNCPIGLEYLTQIDKIMIHQKKSILEAVTEWEVANKYVLLNAVGQQVYYAFEESGCCTRQFCAQNRGFTMHIVDNFQREVLTIRRPFKCCTAGCLASIDTCGHEVSIETPAGEKIGMVRQRFSCCANNFSVLNGDESKEIFKISGPNMCSWTYNCNCCADKVFEIMNPEGQPCGAIRKKWGGWVKEAFTQADTFSVEFPVDLDVRCKAALLGATFLIDFLQFENKQNNVQNAD
ncbi:unnamed protein product, partial [Mesorhabditis belari]|uniref:Phospholipid scramblase n=1 Tax=Mesorhabditis belari TaxID=2138241 RepID=A0AAF3ELN5_9BILA